MLFFATKETISQHSNTFFAFRLFMHFLNLIPALFFTLLQILIFQCHLFRTAFCIFKGQPKSFLHFYALFYEYMHIFHFIKFMLA